jgi:GTPase SAR1 family protein
MSQQALKLIEECLKSRDTYLDLGNCGLTEKDFTEGGLLDETLRKCNHVETLILSNQWFIWNKQNSSWIYKTTKNEGDRNKFSACPSTISALQNLSLFICMGDYNDKWEVSDVSAIAGLKKLKELYLGYNNISELTFLSGLTALELLVVYSNKIESLHGLENLTALKELYIDSNKIKELISLDNLTALEYLDLSSNEIENIELLLPLLSRKDNSLQIDTNATISAASYLLKLHGNPITTPPVEIVQKGNETVLNYFRELEQKGIEYLYEAKMLIVGQPRAGKTSLRYKLFDVNAPLPDEEKTTRGIDIQQLEFDITDKTGEQRTFKYNVWDFGGQQIYQATHQFFLTNRSLYILVMDTGKDSIGNDDTTVNYWLQAIEVLGGGSPMLLVKNEKNERQVNIDLAQKRARFDFLKNDYTIDLNALIAGTKNYNEKRLRDFQQLKQDIQTYLERLPLVGFPMPKNWVKIREELQLLSKDHPYITRHEYINLCKKFDVADFERQMELSRIFHDLGIFLHFQDYAALDEFIILQNTWATDAVFAVLDNPEVKANNGKFTESVLAAIWKNKHYEADVHKRLLALMMQFELCYQVEKGKDSLYIVPEMLDESAPLNYTWEPNNDLPLQYRYDFMPKGLLTRLIVRLHKSIAVDHNRQSVWKTGVKIDGNTLDCPHTFAEIKEAWNNKQLLIRAQSLWSKDLMSKITVQIDLLNNEFFRMTNEINANPKSKVYKMIPCNCELCRNSDEKYFYDYSILLKARERGKNIQCQKSFDEVKVNELLDGVFSNPDARTEKAKSDTSKKLPKIFISYAHLDEPWKDELIKHLSALRNNELIDDWNDRKIEPGLWDDQIENAMEAADIFLLLITHNFLASEYITSKEITTAYNRFKKNEAKIFPVICDSCDWELQPITRSEKKLHPTLNKEIFPWLGQFQPFPKDGKPIRNWSNPQDGFLDVIKQLKKNL